MFLCIVRREIALREPCWFPIWDLAQRSRHWRLDQFLLTSDGTNLQALVLWAKEDLMPMETEECLGSIFAGYKGMSETSTNGIRVGD